MINSNKNVDLIFLELGQMLVKWISSSIAKIRNLNENDLDSIETLISVICTHLIEAGVMKQITDQNEEAQEIFSVSTASKHTFDSISF